MMLAPSETRMVDPAKTFLGKMLLEEITPVVMVLRTPLVEEACLKNGFNFVEMLHPFCLFKNIDVPVRTASDQPYRLHKFKLRLFYASDVRQPNVEAAEEQLKQVVVHAAERDVSDLHSDPPELESVLNQTKPEALPSWFKIFNKELIRTLAFSEHEAFDHPVACLLVVSSKDEQPINKFVDLFNTNQLPSLLNDGAMDPKILKYYLLVHDNQDGTSEMASNILTEMRGTFGSNDCRLLCINSGKDGSEEKQDNPWSAYKNDVPLSEDLGCLLNVNDLNEIKDLMQDLSSKHIIPHMEQKIRMLNQQVSATRKGFRNQIRNLWWRKGKEDTPDAASGAMYTFSSVESQIRVLGDYAFMLRDYELALSNYRLLSTDYKLDKAWKRYAGIQEMMGLAYFMLDQSRKDAEYCMETAFSTYLKIGSSGQRNATRCGLWWAEMLKARDQHKEAASVYFRISNEEPSLHAAVMLEQASYCYLFSNPPMLRKYGFHLVLAGNRYYLSDQRKHAIRTYRSSLSVYKGNSWNYIKDHVHYHVGRWYAILGMSDVAVKHMLEVLACSHESISTQELFLRDFLQIVQKMGKEFEVFRLQLPITNMPSLKIIFEDHRTYASSTAVSVRESLWQSLEENMVPSLPTSRTNWLESQPKYSSKKYKDSSICVAGEAIKVGIEFRNPLQIPISVSGASLICELSARSEAAASEIGGQYRDSLVSVSRQQNDTEFRKLVSSWEQNSSNSLFTLSEVNFSLGGGETIMVQLSVTPKVEGVLKIVGMRWKLSGTVVSYQNFDSDDAKRKNVKGRRKGKQSSSKNLEFVVIKSLPKLGGCIHHLPKRVYAGDLRRLVLELTNDSESSVKTLKMKISHPRFLIPGSLEDMNVEFPSCLERQANCRNSHVQANTVKGSNSCFSFPEDVDIQGGKTLLWPLWLHAAVPGSICLYITIYYEMENVLSEMKYRTLRMHYDLEVLPSLEMSVQISPCPSKLQEFLVRMDVVNKTSSENLQLHQLSSVGWEISSLEPDGTICPSELLMDGQALSFFFKLKNCRKPLTEGSITSARLLQGSDVSLDPQGSNEVLFDISSSVLEDFYHYERLHLGKSIQGHQTTVDFILISQSQVNSVNHEPGWQSDSTQLFSHYACLCSIASTSPVWFLMDGPRIVSHDFSISFCEIRLRMTIHNSSNAAVSVRIDTSDATSSTVRLSDVAAASQYSVSSGNQTGWRDVSLVNDIKITSDVSSSLISKASSPDGITPFVWCASSSTRVELESMSTTEIPLQICVFSPGTYNLSNYRVHWDLRFPEDKALGDGSQQSSGISPGHPFYLNVLQSP
ncbi:PREDICTED: trafficking protein particle complex subunit 8 isoform X2 [Nelumbo nucifera]|uniref:Trafficking protein particle complex subunit 8 isoform X2 n=1 Tax=Nelumbo nucifera TaxID=4432 RepID=A0A1U7Z5H0_NELNU|nr:PREDICTED: trafficking protein particle complex subunit 8 isoform X2 [Nelumbo nucifera]